MSNVMWTEKYRPSSLKGIINQINIVSRLEGFLRTQNLPHLLFAGPPGTGKTTAALALIQDLYKEYWKDNYQELNASDQRGIDVIRTTVKDFARTLPMQKHIPFRIIILDEADNLTSDAQQALRRTMETYVQDCRFILLCNYSSKIISPIQSRCAIFRFSPLKDPDIKNFISHISKEEKLKISKDAIDAILYLARGDMRQAVNLLQASAATGDDITADSIYQFAGQAQPGDIKKLLTIALEGSFIEARKELHQILIKYGLSGTDVIRQMHRELYNLDTPEKLKVRLADSLGEVDFRLTEGADVEIQISAFLSKVALIGNSLKNTVDD